MCDLKVKDLRLKKGMTQAELAQIMGVSIQTIKNWESGKKIPSTAMMKLQEVFQSDNNIGDNTNFAHNINGNNSQNGGAVIEVLAHQLDEKDKQISKAQEQIDRLLSIIEKMNS